VQLEDHSVKTSCASSNLTMSDEGWLQIEERGVHLRRSRAVWLRASDQKVTFYTTVEADRWRVGIPSLRDTL